MPAPIIKEPKPVVFKGKQYPSITELGKEWYKEKKALGWQMTDVGMLPPEEIALSGMKKRADGGWTIPACEYIAEQKTESLNKGQKYIGPTQQFLRWKKRYFPEAKETDVEEYANYSEQQELGVAKPINKNDDDLMEEVLAML